MRSAALAYWDTGYGTARDVELLEMLLRKEDFRVFRVPTRRRTSLWERRWKYIKHKLLFRCHTVQFHLEQIHREQFEFARNNFVIPNPEFTDLKVFPKCRGLTAVLTKTREAEELFRSSGTPARHIGFTTEDNYDPSVQKRFDRFLHVEGKSDFKGSRALVELWSRHPEWPELVVVRSPLDSFGNPRWSHANPGANVRVIEDFIPGQELRRLQNECGFHVCPSEVEGYGHYIAEGVSCGAIVVTTDAPPMNEHVTADTGFTVAIASRRRQGMTWRCSFDADDFERKMQQIQSLDHTRMVEMSRQARSSYLARKEDFVTRFSEVVRGIGAETDLVLAARPS